MNIFSCSPRINHLLEAIGASSHIKWVTKNANNLKDRPDIQIVDFNDPIFWDHISSLPIELIFLEGFEQGQLAEQFANHHQLVVHVHLRHLYAIPEAMVTLGRVLGLEKQAIEKATLWLERFEELKLQGARNYNRVSAVVETSTQPILLGGRLYGELLEVAGYEVCLAEIVAKDQASDRSVSLADLSEEHIDVTFVLTTPDQIPGIMAERNKVLGKLKYFPENFFALAAKEESLMEPFQWLDVLKDLLNLRARIEATGPAFINLD